MKCTEFLKRLCAVFAFGTIITSLSACGGNEPDEPATPEKSYLLQRTCTIQEGAEVDAASTTVVTIGYNNVVTIKADANVTLNGKKVTPVANKSTKMNVDIPLALEDGQSYELIVPEGVFTATDGSNAVNPALTLKFATRKSGEQALPQNGAMALTKMLGFGWNLGNHFDSLDSGNPDANYRITWSKTCPFWDGVNPTEDLYKNLAAAGVKTVRMPVTWGPYENMEDGNYTIDSDYMELVAKNVFWARDNGLIVVLNTHHDEYWQNAYLAGGNDGENAKIKDRIEKTWRQIAERFKEEGDYLILESFNELNHDWKTPNAAELRIQNEWNQLVVDVIRSTGGKNATRWIAVPSYQASPGLALKDTFVLPTDPAGKLIVAVHCYDPYGFTLKNPLDENLSDNDLKSVNKLLQDLKAKFIDNDIPCYLGEFGCSRHTADDVNKVREYYLEYFCRAAHFAGLAACLWDNHNPGGGSEHHAYFSHDNGAWEDNSASLVKKMINALTSESASYSLESIKK